MTFTKKTAKWLLSAATALLLILTIVALPVHAAEGDGRTGETQASVTFTPGELKLVSAPVLDFGSHTISAEAQTYTATTVSPDVQVSDLRGSGGGWDLFVSLSPFAEEEGGAPTLKAAAIEFTSPAVAAVNGTIGTPPAAQATVTLTSDSTETPVMTAAKGAGMGVWSLHWDAANTKLIVQPGTAQEGKNVATLTWSLQTTP